MQISIQTELNTVANMLVCNITIPNARDVGFKSQDYVSSNPACEIQYTATTGGRITPDVINNLSQNQVNYSTAVTTGNLIMSFPNYFNYSFIQL